MLKILTRVARGATGWLREGSIAHFKKVLEARFSHAVAQATRVTNDGAYRVYREGSPGEDGADRSVGEIPVSGGPSTDEAEENGAASSDR